MVLTEDEEAAIKAAVLGGSADIDVHWILYCGTLVFLMQTGFAMLCAGSIRAKNAQNILLKNLLDACVGAIMWWATGYAFAYGETADQGHSKRFIGNDLFFLSNGFEGKDSFHSWFFQWAFAATAATIVSGAGPRHVQARRRRLRDRCARAASTLQCATESVPTNVPRVRSSLHYQLNSTSDTRAVH